ncbi:hypothetical protein WMY93_027135 [Mugilogobius chulae]|uniref:Uncharacterized protein n=1 Tax=Mugilogobius chulae TaxID=88201 RepID=A0AAW0MXZ6_9GOBI
MFFFDARQNQTLLRHKVKAARHKSRQQKRVLLPRQACGMTHHNKPLEPRVLQGIRFSASQQHKHRASFLTCAPAAPGACLCACAAPGAQFSATKRPPRGAEAQRRARGEACVRMRQQASGGVRSGVRRRLSASWSLGHAPSASTASVMFVMLCACAVSRTLPPSAGQTEEQELIRNLAYILHETLFL